MILTLAKYGGTLLIGVGLGVLAATYSVILPRKRWIKADPWQVPDLMARDSW